MATIKKDTLHPENEPEVDIYPKTSIDQVENLQANLDALNGDIANANGEISTVSNTLTATISRVYVNEKNITDLQKDVDKNIMDIATAESNIQGLQGSVSSIAERVDTAETGLVQLTEQVERVGNQTNENTINITKLNVSYDYYSDYSVVDNGFLLTYLSGRKFELPIKAGTNVTFSKYPGTNQIVINATGGSVPDNIAILDANNIFSGSNTFNKLTYFNNQIALGINPIAFNDDTKNTSLVLNYNGFIKRFVDTGNVYSITFPNQTGTIALTTDIPNTSSFATLAGNNNWTGQNEFPNGITMYGGSFNTEYTPEGARITDGDYKANYGGRWITTEYQGQSGTINIPQGKSGTMALVEDIPISLMYSSSRLGEKSVDFPFNINKNYFFTITMTNTGESKSFIYAKGTSSTYTIVINSSTSFEVKLNATGSSTRIIFTNKSNTDPFVVRAEISN